MILNISKEFKGFRTIPCWVLAMDWLKLGDPSSGMWGRLSWNSFSYPLILPQFPAVRTLSQPCVLSSSTRGLSARSYPSEVMSTPPGTAKVALNMRPAMSVLAFCHICEQVVPAGMGLSLRWKSGPFFHLGPFSALSLTYNASTSGICCMNEELI